MHKRTWSPIVGDANRGLDTNGTVRSVMLHVDPAERRRIARDSTRVGGPKRRGLVNWHAIEREYRTRGVVNEIARRHGVSPQMVRRKAAQRQWFRDETGTPKRADDARTCARTEEGGVLSLGFAGETQDNLGTTKRRALRRNWVAIRDEYVTSSETLKEIARRHGVPYETLQKHATDRDANGGRTWAEWRESFRADISREHNEMSRISESLLRLRRTGSMSFSCPKY
jgi:transposase-like protein